MLHSKLATIVFTVFLCVIFASAAAAEAPLGEIWNGGCSLLFDTDSVTVDGEARFSLDGEYFKTAQLHYVQDGYRSFYGLKLLTPKADGSEMETGWTIIADEEGYYYVMEAYHPGTYRVGSDNCRNTLLRRSVELDSLTDLGGIIVRQLTFPEDALTVSETDSGKTVRIVLDAEQVPNLASSALNVCAVFLSDRWFGYGHDRERNEEEFISFDNYVTVTEALTDGTVRWTVRDVDIAFTLDSQGRLTGVKGNLGLLSVFVDGTIREVDVQVDLAITDYNASYVKRFNAGDYNVTLASDYDVVLPEE
ncbi:MAG: hypothetical protein IKH30_14060 [Clostridia bacterium]|nr:hypothetical protein [Clostridia bacterium]